MAYILLTLLVAIKVKIPHPSGTSDRFVSRKIKCHGSATFWNPNARLPKDPSAEQAKAQITAILPGEFRIQG
jgi:hypothetical protein